MPKVKGKVPQGVERITIRAEGTELVVEPTQPTQQQASDAPSVAPTFHVPAEEYLSEESTEPHVTPIQQRTAVRKVSAKRMRAPGDTDHDDDFLISSRKKKKHSSPPRRSPRVHATVGKGGVKCKDPQLPSKFGAAKKASKAVADVKAHAKAGREKRKYYATCRSAPQDIVSLIAAIPKALRNRLVKNGLGDFLKFSFDEIADRQLLCFIMDHIDPGKMQIDLGPGKVVQIDEHAVHCVLGLPNNGDLDPPFYKPSRDKEYLLELKDFLKVAPDKDVSRTKIRDLAAKVNVDDLSVTYFFMCVLNMLLFPTSKNHIRGMDYLWSRDVGWIWKVNWCKAVVEFLKEKVQVWHSNPKRRENPDASTPCIQGCAVFVLILYLDHLLCEDMIEHRDLPRSAFFNASVVRKISQADKCTLKDGTATYDALKMRNLRSTCYWRRDGHMTSPARAILPDATRVRRAKEKNPGAKATRGEVRRDKAYKEGCSKGDHLFLRLEPLLGKSFMYAGPAIHKDAVDALREFDVTVSKGEKMVQEGYNMMTDGQHIILKAQEDIVAKIKSIVHVAARRQKKKKAGQPTSNSPAIPMCTPPSEDEAEEVEAHVTEASNPTARSVDPTDAAVVPSASMHDDDHTGKASPAASAPTGGGNFEVSFNIPHLSTPEQQPEMDVPQVCAQDAADPESLGKITQGANIVEHPVLHPAEEIGKGGQEDNAIGLATTTDAGQGATIVDSPASRNVEQITNTVEDVTKHVKDLIIHESSQSSLGGVNESDFDWMRWIDVAKAARAHGNDDPENKVSDDSGLHAPKVVANPEPVQRAKCFRTKAQIIQSRLGSRAMLDAKKGRKRVSTKIKKVDKLGVEPRTLGQRLRTVPARYSPKSPFLFWKKWRSEPPTDVAETLFYTIYDIDSFESTVFLALPDDHITLTGKEIVAQFAQGNMVEDDVITLFLRCLVSDERTLRPHSAGYRVFLEPSFLGLLLREDYVSSSIYDAQVVVDFLRKKYKPEEFINAMHIFLPVHHGLHWSLYVVNFLHGQIDILDSNGWANDKDRDAYHGNICVRIRDRLHEVLKLFTNGRIVDFSDFGWPYVPVTTQAPLSNDCAIFLMLEMEFYDADSRKTRHIIDPEAGMEYRAKLLFYLMFHRVNCAKRPFPELIEEHAPKSVHFPTLDDDALPATDD